MRKPAFVPIACLALLSVAGCDALFHSNLTQESTRYRRWEAPFELYLGYGPRNIYWVDNERVLHLARNDAGGGTLGIWSVATGEVKAIGPSIGEVCLFEGYLRYVESHQPGPRVVREGTIEQTRARTIELREEMAERDALGLRKHPFNCRYYRPADLAPGENCKVPLRPGDGYLQLEGESCDPEVRARLIRLQRAPREDTVSRSEALRLEWEYKTRPVLFHSSGSRSPIEFAIESNEIGSVRSSLHYVEWLGSYVVTPWKPKGDRRVVFDGWPIDVPYPVYVFNRDGALRVIEIPFATSFTDRPSEAVVTRPGVLLRTPGYARKLKRTVLGLVLHSDEGMELLEREYVQELAVSPDGCRVAYDARINPRSRERPLIARLRVIDFCHGGAT